jgi:hypothetical protein
MSPGGMAGEGEEVLLELRRSFKSDGAEKEDEEEEEESKESDVLMDR